MLRSLQVTTRFRGLICRCEVGWIGGQACELRVSEGEGSLQVITDFRGLIYISKEGFMGRQVYKVHVKAGGVLVRSLQMTTRFWGLICRCKVDR